MATVRKLWAYIKADWRFAGTVLWYTGRSHLGQYLHMIRRVYLTNHPNAPWNRGWLGD